MLYAYGADVRRHTTIDWNVLIEVPSRIARACQTHQTTFTTLSEKLAKG
jgi:hypothetical protein